MANEIQDQNQNQAPDPAAARTFLADFVDPNSIKDAPDADVLALHGKVSAAVAKHAPKGTGTWPDKWRESYVERVKKSASDPAKFDGDKLIARLQRYAGPEAALDALISEQNKIAAGELRTNVPFPDKGTPEQQAAWRKDAGLPEKPEGYSIKLRDGLVPGEDDKPLVDRFLVTAHGANYRPEQVNAALDWYYDLVEEQNAARAQKDDDVRREVEDTLRVEWGPEYRTNKAVIEAFLDTGPAGTKEALFSARLADGTPLASNLNVLRFLADKARELIPPETIVPGEGAGQVKSIEDEIASLQGLMGNKQSEYWKGPKAQDMQQRYRDLVTARDKLKARAKAA